MDIVRQREQTYGRDENAQVVLTIRIEDQHRSGDGRGCETVYGMGSEPAPLRRKGAASANAPGGEARGGLFGSPHDLARLAQSLPSLLSCRHLTISGTCRSVGV
jgi:hypothetical protein